MLERLREKEKECLDEIAYCEGELEEAKRKYKWLLELIEELKAEQEDDNL